MCGLFCVHGRQQELLTWDKGHGSIGWFTFCLFGKHASYKIISLLVLALAAQMGDMTWPPIRDLVDRVVVVGEGPIQNAMQLIFERLKVVVEPSGAIGLAAALAMDFKQFLLETGLLVPPPPVDDIAASKAPLAPAAAVAAAHGQAAVTGGGGREGNGVVGDGDNVCAAVTDGVAAAGGGGGGGGESKVQVRELSSAAAAAGGVRIPTVGVVLSGGNIDLKGKAY